MTTPFQSNHEANTPADLRSVEAELDAIASECRGSPDTGFEDRLVAAASVAMSGRPALRITHSGHNSRGHERHARPFLGLRLGFAAAAVLTIASTIIAIRWQPAGAGPEADGFQIAAASFTELDEIADAWDLLDDEAISSRVTSLHGQAATLSESIHGEWIPASWLSEDSM